MAQERAGSGWTGLKDKVKESLDKVVEVMGSYPIATEDLAVAGVPPFAPVPVVKKKRVRRATVAKTGGKRSAKTKSKSPARKAVARKSR